MAASALIKIGAKIAAKSAGAMKGVAKSTKTFAKSAAKNAKVKKRLRVQGKKFMKNRRERLRRREQEEALEQQKNQRKSERKKTGGAGGGILQRLIAFLQAILFGFIFNQLPKIIKFIKKIIETIQNIVEKFKSFFDSVKGFFENVSKVIKKAFDVIKNITFDNIKEKIMGAFDKIKDGFINMKDKLGDAAKNFLGMKKKPKKEIKTELDKKEVSNEKNVASVSDIQSTMSKQNNDWNNTIKSIEKAGTGVDIVGKENLDKIIDTSTPEGEKEVVAQKKEVDAAFKKNNMGATTNTGTGKITIIREDGSTTTDFREIKAAREAYQSTISNNVNNMGGDSVKISTNTGKDSTKSFNMVNINKGRVNTGKITPKRKSGHTIMMVNNNSASQSGGTGSGTKTKIVVVKEKNTADDQLNLALSE
tara:strand:- start:1194 stop:2453 length:1260 start_codon:yes stop_codon:yes gene_type:complete